MDAVELLKADHKKVKELFRKFESAGDRAYKEKKEIAETVFMELDVHAKLEEEIFYPAVRAKGNKEDQEVVDESFEEHHVVDVLIAEMRKMDPKDDGYEAKFAVVMEMVEHHIEEEEGEMFPDAQKKLGNEMMALGERMMKRKEELTGETAKARR